jgi:hypothetical protein
MRTRAAIDRLLRGEIPPSGGCGIKTLTLGSGVDRTAFYGNRPYAHLRTEFEDRLQRLRGAGQAPDPGIAQLDRLKMDNVKLKERLAHAEQAITELDDLRRTASARLAAQHEEIVRLRGVADASARIVRLPAPRTKTQAIGPC